MIRSGAVQNKVVIVTGGGRGIGREIALLMGAEGARIVVNDLGTSISGAGSDLDPAKAVAEEIRAAGGEAVPDGNSVATWEGAQSIVATALAAYGRVDCVINNAGIVRDRIFHKMSPEEFETVVRVHLFGAFYVSRAAAEHFRAQEHGSFVHMTSSTGLIGNNGQANYGAAKLGVVALSKCIALDMRRYNVRSNCISPGAFTRMSDHVPANAGPEQIALRDQAAQGLPPAKVAPLAVFLASDLSREVTGQILAIRGNEVFLYNHPRPIRSVHRSDGWTAHSLAVHMLPAFRSSFAPLEVITDVFSWQPI